MVKRYCIKSQSFSGDGFWYSHIYPSIKQVQMCVDKDEPIYEIDVVEASDPSDDSYWGWMDEHNEISMIYPNAQALQMCFPYGIEAEERAGRGRVIRVDITEIFERGFFVDSFHFVFRRLNG